MSRPDVFDAIPLGTVIALGLHEVARYYYYRGWQKPGPSLELIINRRVFDGLPDDLRAINAREQ